MKRKTYHVTKTDEGWKGKLEGAERASIVAPTKEEAVKLTIELAKKQELSSVVIHTKTQIQEERTYGKDPFPPEG